MHQYNKIILTNQGNGYNNMLIGIIFGIKLYLLYVAKSF